MSRDHVKIFRHLHIMDGKMEHKIAETFGQTPIKAEKRYGKDLETSGGFQNPQDVGRIAAPGENQKQVSRFGQRLQLFGKNIFIAGVVAQTGEDRSVGRKGVHTKCSLAVGVGSINQVRGEMIGVGGTAAVAGKKNGGPALPSCAKFLLNLRPAGTFFQMLKTLHQEIPVGFQL